MLTTFSWCATAQQTPSPEQLTNEQLFEQLPWPVKIGVRSHQVSQVFPLIDRVVLVPDAATYLDELAKWSPRGRWPVLFDDHRYAPMFTRRFGAEQVIRRESIGADTLPRNAALQKAIETVVIRTFDGDPTMQSIQQAFAQQKFVPAGVVVSSAADPAWTAAVALAAGRGQPLLWIDQPYGNPNDELDDETARRLIDAIESGINRLGYDSRVLGDAIDTITVCRAMAVRANILLPVSLRAAIPPPYNEGPVALTDLIGRHDDGTRFACTGWIFGDQARCAYTAMCSLFLPREDLRLFNGYPSSPEWQGYAMAAAAQTFSQAGFDVQQQSDAAADEQSWLRSLMGGWSNDIALINSKGNFDFFDLSSGRGHVGDVPVLNRPLALHLIHSWSMRMPDDPFCIGQVWLDSGAYAAVGSCWEPLLGAFVPPGEYSRRLTNFVPFLVAARWYDGQGELSKPWRVVTIGDPQMLCAPPAQNAKPRIHKPAEYGVDVAEDVKSLMRAAANGQPDAFANALRALDLLGRDEIALQVWRMAAEKGHADTTAAAALPALFRMRKLDEFLRAWDTPIAKTRPVQDMAWHLVFPRLGGKADRDMLAILQSSIRQPSPLGDLRRLAPHLARAFGNVQAREVIQREIAKAKMPGVKADLTQLLEEYKGQTPPIAPGSR